jgi:hypothetical protein
MKYLLVIVFLSFCLFRVSAQEKHFVFIQSDNHEPFYVSLNGKLYSSSATGYIIIPKLSDGAYDFSIGFAKNAFPEQSFRYEINKDLGFNLKNFGEKGWGLFNLQTLNVTMAESGKTNNISKALSEKDAAKDDTEPVISFDRKKKETKAEQPVAQNTATTAVNEPVAQSEKPADQEVNSNNVVAESTQDKSPASDQDVTKVSESKVDDGLHLTYVEGDGKKGDTINVIIPSDKSLSNTENNNSNTAGNNSSSETSSNSSSLTEASNGNDNTATKPVATEGPAKDNLKFLDVNMDKSKKDVRQETAAPENNAPAITNSKCKNIATDDDYARLRRKMAMETTDEKMINVARKVYRNKCFTTRQLKSLSTLFLSDQGRFDFLNASYNSVSDVSEYATLQSEFIDPAFVDRFKAMLK